MRWQGSEDGLQRSSRHGWFEAALREAGHDGYVVFEFRTLSSLAGDVLSRSAQYMRELM